MKKALIAMSGGVDSSVAALLTAREGYDCIGCTMRLYTNEDAGLESGRTCCSLDDAEDARSVAFRLGMPFYVFNYTDEFRRQVIAPFVECYRRGLTPNPCIECNAHMKFARLMDRARELGCEKLVTGHYARIAFDGEKYALKKALDPDKDQSYVLYMLSQEQLAMLSFPLGGMTKDQTRALAEGNGFRNAAKPDSQDICFVPDGDYAGMIRRFTGRELIPGDFTDAAGNVLGRHKGIECYTVGQRRGLGLSFVEPHYVIAVRPEDNTVVLGRKEELFSRRAWVERFHWIAGEEPAGPLRCRAKIRYRHAEQAVTITPDGAGGAFLDFDEPQRAVTPGQSAVAYDGDTVLGGGVLCPLPAEEKPAIIHSSQEKRRDRE